MSLGRRREMVDRGHPSLPVVRQCALLGISRSGLYYQRKGTSAEDMSLMKEMGRQYLETPFYGSCRMRAWLKREGRPVSRKRVRRLMRVMGLRAIYRRPKTSRPALEHRAYPYLLEKAKITRPNQVWAADVTYIPMSRGFLYLAAIMDWYSRYVVAWRLSNTLEADFCIDVLDEALGQGNPEIFNTDQGSQFTGQRFIRVLQDHGVEISHDGKGRYQDNIFVERLWRTVKYEEVYLKGYPGATEVRKELGAYFSFYNNQRPHQALGYRTPAEVFFGNSQAAGERTSNRRWAQEPVLATNLGPAELSLNSAPTLSN